jgi:hypothetical protein
MTRLSRKAITALLLVAATATAACGSSSSKSSSAASGGSGSLSAEVKSAATGDIPDNQNFLTFNGTGYSIKYPEGWAQSGKGGDVSFRDKNNIVHVVVGPGAPLSASGVTAQLAKEHIPALKAGTPTPVTLKAGKAVKVTYTSISKPNPVTGKREKLTVDRYVLAKGGKRATIDLGTAVGVDNVDAYRLMAGSFQWR